MSNPLALIVEDHEDAAIIFSEALKAAGFETETIRSGDLAMKRLAEIVPDMVILDLNLPHVSGAETLAKIRADDRLANTCVIARVHELLERLAKGQEEDGYLGITPRFHRNPVRGMELYGRRW